MRGWLTAVAAIAGAALVAHPGRLTRSARWPAEIQSSITAPDTTAFFGVTPQFAMAPAGDRIVLVATAQGEAPRLWLRPLSSGAPRPLPGTELASYPFWSPDGRHIGFFASGKLKRVAIDAGGPVIVCDAPTGRGGTWNERGVIVFASGLTDPLRRVPASGGVPVPVTVVDTTRESSHRWPQFLPDGTHLLFWAGGGTGASQLKIASLESTDVTSVGPSDTNGAYAAGYVFFKSGSALMAHHIDTATFEENGAPVTVVTPISSDAGSAFASFSASTTGSIVYAQGTARPLRLTWFSRAGEPVGTIGEPGQYTNVSLSPDGRHVAVSLTTGTPANRDVWIMEVATGGVSRVTTDAAVDATPIWSPDGTRIAFSSPRAGPYQMYTAAATGRDGAYDESLLAKTDGAAIATDWSRDGRFIVYTRIGGTTGLDVWVLPLSGDRRPTAFVETAASEDNAAFSPDGRWIAYQSNESGSDEVYLRAFPAAGGPFRVSRNGGTQPRWRADGAELFFLAADGSLMAANIRVAAPFASDPPRAIIRGASTLVIRHAYTVTGDGQRVLMPVVDQRNPSVLTVVRGWSPSAPK